MSEDERSFLARWSQRKREAGKEESKQVAPDASAPSAQPSPEAVAAETDPPFDLESLPKIDDLTASTDMTVFFRKGVPESIRNAALRKSWALDPAIRNYVNPALDYAYDWNTPGGVPGSGELAPGTDIARMVLQVMGGGEPRTPQDPVDKAVHAATATPDDPAADVVEQMRQTDAAPQSVRLTNAAPQASSDAGQTATTSDEAASGVNSERTQDEAHGERHSFASQHDERRHGTARPK